MKKPPVVAPSNVIEVLGTKVGQLFRWPTLRTSERVVTMAHKILLVSARGSKPLKARPVPT